MTTVTSKATSNTYDITIRTYGVSNNYYMLSHKGIRLCGFYDVSNSQGINSMDDAVKFADAKLAQSSYTIS